MKGTNGLPGVTSKFDEQPVGGDELDRDHKLTETDDKTIRLE